MAAEIFKHKTFKSLMKCVKTLFDLTIITTVVRLKKIIEKNNWKPNTNLCNSLRIKQTHWNYQFYSSQPSYSYSMLFKYENKYLDF